MKTLSITKHGGVPGLRDFLAMPFWIAASVFALLAAVIDGGSSISMKDEK